MEVINSQDVHIVEVHGDAVERKTQVRGRRNYCGEVNCEFKSGGKNLEENAERSASMRKLFIAAGLCVLFMTVEVIGGIRANSLAILTDAAHLLADVAAFAISLFSLWAAGWEATPQQSYGFLRVEILGTLVSIQLIWLLAGILVYEAVQRLINETGEVNGFLMFLVSAFGLVVNIIMVLVLGHDHAHGHGHGHGHFHENEDEYKHDHKHEHGHGSDHIEHNPSHSHGVIVTSSPHNQHSEEEHNHNHEQAEPLLEDSHTNHEHNDNGGHGQKRRNINVQGAYLHILGDSIQSVGVMIGGAVIWYKPEWKMVDLICTLVFSVLVLGTTFKMLRDILEVLMESTPREVDATKLQKGLLDMEDVVAIHELHIWAITLGKILLACHVKIKPEADADIVLEKVIGYIRREYNISHVTIQIER